MPLNIYIISHPIINKLSTDIIYSEKKDNQLYTHVYNQINFLLIYELLRKWIKIQNLYIKDIDYIKEISIFDPKESYLLFTNLENCCDIINNLKTIIPKLYLIHTYTNENKENYIKIHPNFNYDIKNNKIIIMEKILNNYSIINFIDNLINKYQITSTSIKIICIACNNNILKVINNKYSTLEIYTTKIISK
nr:hypothetical protein [Calliblepharis sp.]